MGQFLARRHLHSRQRRLSCLIMYVRFGSFSTELGSSCHVRYTSDSDRAADIHVRQLRAKLRRTQYDYMSSALPSNSDIAQRSLTVRSGLDFFDPDQGSAITLGTNRTQGWTRTWQR